VHEVRQRGLAASVEEQWLTVLFVGFFASETQKQELSADRISDQKTVDAKVLDAVKKVEFMKPYLNARFSLSKGDKPHAMVF